MTETLDLLVVEDDGDWQELISGWSERANLSFQVFYSGVQALSYLDGLSQENLPRAYLDNSGLSLPTLVG